MACRIRASRAGVASSRPAIVVPASSWPAIVGPASPRSAWMSLTASLKSGRHISDLLGVLADGRSGELADRAGRGVAGIIKPGIIKPGIIEQGAEPAPGAVDAAARGRRAHAEHEAESARVSLAFPRDEPQHLPVGFPG